MIKFALASRAPRVLAGYDWPALGKTMGRHLKLRHLSSVGLKFVSAVEMRQLNRAYRQADRPTDVLSFEAAEVPGKVANPDYLGDIVICPSYAQAEAKRQQVDVKEELLRLVVHGVLHLCGYDHCTPKQEAKMFKLQEQLVMKHVARNT